MNSTNQSHQIEQSNNGANVASGQFSIQVSKSDLLEALRCQQSVVDRKAIQPVFSHVKLAATNNHLSIEGHDGTMLLKYEMKCNVENQGVITLPAQILYNLVRKADGDFVTISSKNDIVTVQYKSGKFELNSLDPATLPTVPNINAKLAFTINSLDLVQYFKLVKIGMANDEIRTYFNGVYIENKDNQVNFVATDAHRLAMYAVDKIESTDEFNMILSRKNVETLCSLITKSETISCYKDENQVKFVASDFVLTSRLISGKFPENYPNLIPNSVEGIFEDSVDNLKDSIERISILSSQLSKNVQVKLQAESTIKCNNVSYGSGEEKLQGSYKGEDFTFEIDVNIWLDFLRLFDKGNIKLIYHGATKPIAMHHQEHKGLVYICMPIT